MCACGISYMAGRYSGRQKAPAAAGSEGGTEETTSQYTDLPPGSPSFLFPPGTAFREATPSNVDIMDSQVLNLAYLYEDGADSTDPADSYAGRLYDMPVSYTHLCIRVLLFGEQGRCIRDDAGEAAFLLSHCSPCAGRSGLSHMEDAAGGQIPSPGCVPDDDKRWRCGEYD